jgi:hypothetical protein
VDPTQTPTGGTNIAAPALATESISIRQGATALGEARRAAASAPAEDAAQPDPSPAQERGPRDDRGRFARSGRDEEDTGIEPVSAAPHDEAPGDQETDKDDPADDQPSIDPPRSWTKEDKEAFKALPREVQERIAQRERAREAELRRGQDKNAEERKAVEAAQKAALERQQQFEKARQQYEGALPQLLGKLQSIYAGEFSDIKTTGDVQKLAAEDPFRFAKFQAHRMELERVATELRGAQTRQAQEQQQALERQQAAFVEWANDQDRRFAERAPEFSDAKKVAKAREAAVSYITEELGLSQQELDALWAGRASLSLRDHRVQLALRDAARWREAQKQAKAAARPNAPPVQRPGVASTRTESKAAEIETLTARLDNGSGSTRDKVAAGAALLRAMRSQGARKSA